MSADGFTTEIKFYPSRDHREESRNKGCRSATLSLILRGPDAVLTTDVFTGWMAQPLERPYLSLKSTPGPWPRRSKPGFDADSTDRHDPAAAGTHLHSPTQRKDWWVGPSDDCTLLDGQPCYGDTGYMVSDQVLEALVAEGSEAAFARMREIYDAWMAPDEDAAS